MLHALGEQELKKSIVVTIFVIHAGWASSQSDMSADAVARIEKQVSLVEGFFAQPQQMLLLNKNDNLRISYSYLAQYVGSGVKYDVRRTDSLVSPLTAQIVMTLQSATNEECGNVPFLRSHIGWRTEAEAIASSTKEGCFQRRPPLEATFSYSYQKDRWVFRSVTGRYLDESLAKTEPLLSATLGTRVDNFQVVTTEEGQKFNALWKRAFLPTAP